jgi:hypothetical protein
MEWVQVQGRGGGIDNHFVKWLEAHIMVSVAKKIPYMQALVKTKQCLWKKKFIYKCANVDMQADTHTSNWEPVQWRQHPQGQHDYWQS